MGFRADVPVVESGKTVFHLLLWDCLPGSFASPSRTDPSHDNARRPAGPFRPGLAPPATLRAEPGKRASRGDRRANPPDLRAGGGRPGARHGRILAALGEAWDHPLP